MNLVWLKYVSYALLAGAAFLYFAIRLNKLRLSRATKAVLYVICIVISCVAWRVQERNTDLHSPRRLIVGTVTSVAANHHKGGSVDYDFQLRTGSGSISQQFNTDIVSNRDAEEQPIHYGDLLGVLYRTWDGAPVTIDEIQGQQPGWHYRRYDDGSAFVFGVTIGGLGGLISALVATRNLTAVKPSPTTTLNLNE